MTPEEHNRTLGILHLVYGGLNAITMLGMMVMLFLFFEAAYSSPGSVGGDALDSGLMFVILAAIIFFSMLFTIPPLVAGYGLLKRKSWAKLWGLIAGVVAGMSFPLGTALCVYTIWFMFGPAGGQEIYGDSQTAGRPRERQYLYGAPPPAGWAAQYAKRERDYAPPPDWRS